MKRALTLTVLALSFAAPASAQWYKDGSYTWTWDYVGCNAPWPDYPLEVHATSQSGSAAFLEQSFSNGTALRSFAHGVDSTAVLATSWATSGDDSCGVRAQTYSTEGYAVRASALAGAGPNCAIYGVTNSPNGYSGRFAGGRFYVTTDFAGINRDSKITSSEVFGVTAKTSAFGGMYMTTSVGGKPFYGYATGTAAKAYHFYDSDSRDWRLWVHGTRLVVDGDQGYVGIGTTDPQHRLHVAGDAAKPGGGSWTATSDRRLKKDVEALDGSLDRLLALRGVSFEFIDPDAIDELPGRQTGVIAQEVEQVFPEWVDEGADGYKRVTFRGFEALTVEALRELRAENDALRRENDELRESIARIHELLEQR